MPTTSLADTKRASCSLGANLLAIAFLTLAVAGIAGATLITGSVIAYQRNPPCRLP